MARRAWNTRPPTRGGAEGAGDENPFLEDAKRWVSFSPPKPAPDAKALITEITNHELREIEAEISRVDGLIAQHPQYESLLLDRDSLLKRQNSLEVAFASLATDEQELIAAALRSAPVPAAVDAIEAAARIIETCEVPHHRSTMRGPLVWLNPTRALLAAAVRAHDAVPPADGAVGLNWKLSVETVETLKEIDSNIAQARNNIGRLIVGSSPSLAVAAEPVAHRWRNHVGDFDWSEWHPLQGQTPEEFRRQFANGFARGEFELQPLYPTPSVRGDRELLEQCAKIAQQFELDMSNSQLDDRAIELIKRGANEASVAIESAILSLPVQPGAGERETAIAKASALARRLCQLFDSGGESQRTVRARHASAIFQLIGSYETEQRQCDADPVGYLEQCERLALSRQAPHSSSEGESK